MLDKRRDPLIKSRLLGAVCACVVASGIFTSANAALVNGSLSLSGGFIPVDSVPQPTSLGTATGIAFDGTTTVDQGTGDFLASVGNLATMGDFQFSPALNPNPVDVWMVDGFTFSMDAVAVDFQNNTFLLLSGSGTVSAAGFDDTAGTWVFSAQSADQTTFSWSSSTSTVVPVPAAVWLFGSGLIGLVGLARRKKAA
jgi:hypothetical protein